MKKIVHFMLILTIAFLLLLTVYVAENSEDLDDVKANIEAYAALEANGHVILPKADQEYKTKKWFKRVLIFYKLMSATSLGRICASDHAMNAADEMQALAIDMKAEIARADMQSIVFDEIWEDINTYL